MSTRTKKTVAISLLPEEVVALDRVRQRDNLTRAEALREAIRRYVSQDSDRQIPVEDALPDEIEAIEGRAGANRAWRVCAARRPKA